MTSHRRQHAARTPLLARHNPRAHTSHIRCARCYLLHVTAGQKLFLLLLFLLSLHLTLLGVELGRSLSAEAPSPPLSLFRSLIYCGSVGSADRPMSPESISVSDSRNRPMNACATRLPRLSQPRECLRRKRSWCSVGVEHGHTEGIRAM